MGQVPEGASFGGRPRSNRDLVAIGQGVGTGELLDEKMFAHERNLLQRSRLRCVHDFRSPECRVPSRSVTARPASMAGLFI